MVTQNRIDTLAIKALATLAAGLALSACSGNGADSGSQRDSSQALRVEVLPDTYIAGGKAAAITMAQSEQDGQTIVEVLAEDAEALKGLYFTLHYDPAQYSPLSAEPVAALGPEGEVISLSNMASAGRLMFGEMVVRPQDKTASGGAKGFSGAGVLARIVLEQRSFRPGRQLSAAPSSDASRTTLAFNPATLEFSWQYFSQGDYDQNGEVGISDLTPLGMHFNEPVPLVGEFLDQNSVESVIDGDGNGQITIADLTPIGQNFGNRVASYLIYADAAGTNYPASNDAADSIASFDGVAFSSALGSASAERLHFSFTSSGLIAAQYFVRPADAESNPGTPSNQIDLSGGVPNIAPVASIEADIVSGTLPLEVHFTATATDANGDALTYAWSFGPSGSYVNTAAVNTATYTYNASAQWTARVYVNDGSTTTQATVDVVVATPGGNVAPLVSLSATPSDGFLFVDAVLTAEVIDPDAGQTHTFEWDYTNDFSIDFGPDPTPTQNYGYNYDFVLGGYYSARVVVSDGFDTAEATADINVYPPDNPPVFDYFNADLETGPAPLTVTFSALATDSDGDLVSYLWDFGTGTFVGGGETEVHTFETPGNYQVFCRAEDGIEGTTASPIMIFVTAP